jgi:peroxiredoxin
MKAQFSFAILLAALFGAAPLAAQEAPPAEIGLRVGAHAPAFTLKDQNGKEITLEALLKKGPVALVFYRSADWCMFCKFELVHLQRNLKEFQAAGGQVVGISYDSTIILKRFADNQHITFPLLSDESSKTIEAYDVRDKTPKAKPGFAAHASFVLDQTGVVRAKFLDVIYQEQPGVGILLKAIREARNAAGRGPSLGAEGKS